MNKEELLKRLKAENEGKDPYEGEITRLSWMLGAISALVVAVIIYLAELILWDKYNVGVFVVAVTMATVMLAIRAIKLRSKFETVMAILFGVIWLALIVTYVIAINYGWV